MHITKSIDRYQQMGYVNPFMGFSRQLHLDMQSKVMIPKKDFF